MGSATTSIQDRIHELSLAFGSAAEEVERYILEEYKEFIKISES